MLTHNAESVLQKRYYTKDAEGKVNEDWPQLADRVGGCLAGPEDGLEAQALWRPKFGQLVHDLLFLPNSPTLANAWARTGQLGACFVLGVNDDLGDIFDAVKYGALIHQTGGGTGYSMSRLRPEWDDVGGNQGVSSGPLSFLDVFNQATEVIKQGGMRRGANMGILRVDHPDILKFIRYKKDLLKLTNFNISVAITDKFMQACADGTSYDLINPRTGLKSTVKNPETGEVLDELDARTVWEEIIANGWATGEPGIVFIDRMNNYCPVPWMGKYEATNPCGEQPLIPYESCNLGSINLEKFIRYDQEEGQPVEVSIDWDALREVVWVSTRLLDNVVDANTYPIQQVADVTRATRKIGLGVMGFARMCFLLGVAYGSETSFILAEQIMSFIDFNSKACSIQLAKTKGRFPASIGHEAESFEIYQRWFTERAREEHCHPEARYTDLLTDLQVYGIRNSTTTTIAPTGTLSIIADTSGGCEPVFALAFKRFQAGMEMTDSDKVFLATIKMFFGTSAALDILRAVEQNHGSLQGLELSEIGQGCWTAEEQSDFEAIRRVFVTAHDLTPGQHVHMQSAFQKYNDSATSKTINFPESATLEEVSDGYNLAWLLGCKGFTMYRNNSRKAQPLQLAVVEKVIPQAAPVYGGHQTKAEYIQNPMCCPTPAPVAANGCYTCSNCNHTPCG